MNMVTPTQEEEALAGMPGGEQSFLLALLEFTRSARQNPDREVALAARRREGVLRFKLAGTRQKQHRRAPAPLWPLQRMLGGVVILRD